jgi:cell division protein FtsI/penicillin-binding protein 2
MMLGWKSEKKIFNWRFNPRMPKVQEKQRPPWRFGLRALGLMLAFSAVCVSLLCAAKEEIRHPGTHSPFEQGPSPEPASFSQPWNGPSPSFTKIWEGKFIEEHGPYQIIYTVDPVLQASVDEVFHKHRPPFSAFIALDPKTGRILALVDYSGENSDNGGVWRRATYPAASVFKIITAASALEKGVLNFDSSVSFRGNQYRLGPSKISKPSKWDQQTQFDEALGKSNNVVFGRVASNLVGPETLRQYSQAFGFNRLLPFDFPLESSKANIPEGSYELARCGAGFGEVTLNPLHGAMIVACIANGGTMMRPYLIETVRNKEGEAFYRARTEVLAQPISAKTALDLNRMMRRTVEDGTASRIFHRYGKDLVKRITISGKTGSLSGHNPPGLYDWFVGFAPADNPQIAFSAMVINHRSHKFRGVFVAEEALKTFFRDRLD